MAARIISAHDPLPIAFRLILCAQRDAVAVAHYALVGLPKRVLAAEYRTALPDKEVLAARWNGCASSWRSAPLQREDNASGRSDERASLFTLDALVHPDTR